MTTKTGSAKFNKNLFRLDVRAYSMIIAIIAIWTFFSFMDDSFLTARNFSNLFVQMSVTSILAIGMVLVLVAGQVDLSVGSLVGLTGGIAGILHVWYGWDTVPVVIVTILLGAMIGLIQGWWVAYRAVPAFIVTLGGMMIFRGALQGITKSETIAPLKESFKALGQGFILPFMGYIVAGVAIVLTGIFLLRQRQSRVKFGFSVAPVWMTGLIWLGISALIFVVVSVMNAYQGIPIPFMVVVFLAIVFTFIAKKTVFGRQVYAIGGNSEAAVLSGINVKRKIMLIFVLCNTLAAVAGLILTARVNAATVGAGTMYELDAIAACVIGGTSLMGGVGTIPGAMIGALVMASLDNGMSILNIDSFWQLIVKGSILVFAVWFDIYSRSKAKNS
ncbi:D-xylose transport system permease protein [Thermoactinomyces sp. DSM 45891]|uniref:sugar ABC transporter permease n=1 Tax=Thermoactinomyces sp. DSM 45891 TaxID=1761907 RepID=UPI00091111FC|nr:sugar ABC transporter permease [Thermoactinomyces sp. DSM 45891]SFX65373.1 D-xylose transport system permease protein [Thermoactinomyces sp. DSM 45891]